MNKKICTRILVALLALVMIIGLLPVASMAEDAASNVTEYHFDVKTDVVGGDTPADKTAIADGTTYADGYFKIVGTGVVYRWSESKNIYAIEITKNEQTAVEFTTTGTAAVTLKASSTGGSNTSVIAIYDADGNAVANAENVTINEVAGTGTTTITYTDLPAGTYKVVSPIENVYKRSVRLMGIDVAETASAAETVKGWVKVTDTSTLKAGDVLALGSTDGNYAAGELIVKNTGTDYYISQVAADWTQIKEDTLQLTLGGSAGAWTLLNSEGQDLKVTKSSNACVAWNTGDTDYTWTISVNADGLATIVGVDETFERRTLLWNDQGDRFGNYKEATPSSTLPILYRLEDVPVGGGNEGDGEGEGGNEGGGNEPSNAPTVGTEYYLGVKHGGNDDLEMFFNGLATTNAAYRMQIVEATKENPNGAVKVLLEEATGGYNLYFMVEDAKQYLIPVKSGNFNNINISATAGIPWTWDAENEILVADLEGTTILMAASGTYINFEAKKLEQLASVYPLKLYTELPTAEAGGDEPVALSSIADVLAGTKGSKYAIKGEITYIDGKSIYLQDATGAMAIYLAAANTEWKIGDTVEAEGVLDVYNGLPQLKNLTKSEHTAGTATIQPIKGGIAVYADANLCKLITLEGEFTVTTVSTSSSGNVTVTLTDADDNEITLFKPAKTLAEGDKVTSITGVLSTYNKLQIRTDEEADIVLATAGGNEGGDITNPDNGDNSMVFVMVGFASLMAMAAVVVVGKKRMF